MEKFVISSIVKIAIVIIFLDVFFKKWREEKIKLIFLAVIFGVLLGVINDFVMGIKDEITGGNYNYLINKDQTIVTVAVASFLIFGPIEEGIKCFGIQRYFKNKSSDIEKLLYGCLVCLGFELFEKIIFFFYVSPVASPTAYIPLHPIFSSFIMFKLLSKSDFNHNMMEGFFVAAISHGLFDFLIGLNELWGYPVYLSIGIYLYILLLYSIFFDRLSYYRGRSTAVHC